METRHITIVPCGHQCEEWLTIFSDGRIERSYELDGYAAGRSGSRGSSAEINMHAVAALGTHYQSGRPVIDMVREAFAEMGVDVRTPRERLRQLGMDRVNAVLAAVDEVVDLVGHKSEFTTDELSQMAGALRDAIRAAERVLLTETGKREFKFTGSEKGRRR